MRRVRWLTWAALIVMVLAGFGTVDVAAAEGDYLIAPSDILEISVYGEEALTKGELVVRPDGKVSFPLLGDIQAAGKTTLQVKEAVEKKAVEFIPGAIANVSVMQLTSLQYFVLGKVAKPGMFNVSKPLTVLQALALAGGPVTFADEDDIKVMRQEGSKTIKLPFNYKDVKRGKNLDQNIVLERGDVVVVP